MQKERENYYLQKYLPLLNTIFKSNLGDIQTYESLHELLKLKQLNNDSTHQIEGNAFENIYKRGRGVSISIYLYKYVNGQLRVNYTKFDSINKLSKEIGISRVTISIYLNTYVPFKGNLFLTFILEDFEILDKLVSDAILGLELDRTESKKVWMYYIDASGKAIKKPYESIGLVAKALRVHHTFINKHIDKWIIGGIEGNYLFSKE